MKNAMVLLFGCVFPVVVSAASPTASSASSVLLDQNVKFNANGFSTVIEFQVEPDTVSFVVQATGYAGSAIAIKAVQNPAKHFVTGDSFSLSESPNLNALTESENPQNISVAEGFASVLVPNNGTTTLIPGKWKLQAMCYSEPKECAKFPARVQVISKVYHGDVRAARATVPLRLRFTGARGWTAQNASQNPEFSMVIKLLKEKMKAADLNMSIVGLNDANVNPYLKSFEESLEFVRGIAVDGTAANERAISVTFATGSQGFPATAISFGLPGPVSTFGRDGFGILQIVEYGDIPRDQQIFESPEAISKVLMHEIGHYLGLFHVCERSQNFQSFTKGSNPLTDTQCKSTNLMYPGADSALLTPQQLAVLKRHPIVRLDP